MLCAFVPTGVLDTQYTQTQNLPPSATSLLPLLM